MKISVADTGCGMAPDVRERAFEPFFTTKPVGKGTGLGLSQIFGFAHESGGEVGIESEVGKGTIVSIYLPRTEAVAPVRLHAHAQRTETADVHVPGARILLVEDDPRVRSATVGALEDLDYEPVACAGGAEAVQLFNSQPFDLVITDVIMPEMSGPELIRYLKSTSPRDFAVLFVTGYVGEGETDDLRGYELLRKPFTVGALASAVAAALARNTEPPRAAARARRRAPPSRRTSSTRPPAITSTGGSTAPNRASASSAAFTVPGSPLIASSVGRTRAIERIASPIWPASSTS